MTTYSTVLVVSDNRLDEDTACLVLPYNKNNDTSLGSFCAYDFAGSIVAASQYLGATTYDVVMIAGELASEEFVTEARSKSTTVITVGNNPPLAFAFSTSGRCSVCLGGREAIGKASFYCFACQNTTCSGKGKDWGRILKDYFAN
jgi:hypothetical protein